MAARTKAEWRLLIYMTQHGTAAVSSFDSGKRLLMAADRSRLLIESALFDKLERDGLLLSRGAVVELTDLGTFAAKRLQDGGETPFAGQHRTTVSTTVVTDNGTRETVRVNTEESPLARLATRTGRNGKPYIGASQFQAGERLRQDFERSQMRQRVTASWDIGGGAKRGKGSAGGMADLSDNALDARKRLRAALSQVDAELAAVLEDVCCHLKGVETVERERKWPPRSAKLMLRTGLNLLARHYGTTAGDGRGVVRTRHWKA